MNISFLFSYFPLPYWCCLPYQGNKSDKAPVSQGSKSFQLQVLNLPGAQKDVWVLAGGTVTFQGRAISKEGL